MQDSLIDHGSRPGRNAASEELGLVLHNEWIRVPPGTPMFRKEKDMSKGKKTKHGKKLKKQAKRKK